MRLPLTCLLFLLWACASAQTITIKRVQLAGEKVIVTYDLEDNNPNNEYLLNLYASKDNFAVPLSKVSGDVGMDIKPGAGKQIEWNIIDEFGGYKGKLSLEVRGKVYVPFVRLQDFNTDMKYKRGKSYTVKWRPGNSNPVIIELYKAGQRISGDVNQPNNGSYTLFVPKHAKDGKDYYLKITDARNSDEVINTGVFTVASAVPFWAKIAAPVVVAGGVAAVVLSGGGGNGEEPPGNESDIPDPGFPRN